MTEIPSFKCILVGDGAVGKTSYIQRHCTGEYATEYIATLGVNVTPIVFSTTFGPIRFNMWDCAGQPQFGGLREGYYVQAQCAIIMYDLTDKKSFEHVELWRKGIIEQCGNIPMVVVGNKFDLVKDRDLKPETLYMSLDTGYQFELPFLYLSRQLLNFVAPK